MRLSAPRITPSESHEWDADQRALMAKMERGVGPVNVIRTLVRHEKLLRRWLPFANHLLFKSTLPRSPIVVITPVKDSAHGNESVRCQST